jgi:Holliday junction resolvase RusA-like endonuclease
MGKTRGTITCFLPAYRPNDRRKGYKWRKDILECVQAARRKLNVDHDPESPVEVVVLLYLKEGKKKHEINDVDNRLKDILDALQGRHGGGKSDPAENRLFKSDQYVRRVVIEKQPTPKIRRNARGSALMKAGGRILIRPYKPRKWPLQTSK